MEFPHATKAFSLRFANVLQYLNKYLNKEYIRSSAFSIMFKILNKSKHSGILLLPLRLKVIFNGKSNCCVHALSAVHPVSFTTRGLWGHANCCHSL